MDLRIGHLTFSSPPPAPRRAKLGAVPATPPPDALREADRAGARADEPWRDQRELHFAVDADTGRVIVQVRDLDGCVIRTIPSSEALDIMSGKPL